MIVGDVRSLRFSSLKSFGAQRQTPKVALSMMMASLRSCFVVYLQVVEDTQHGGIPAFYFFSTPEIFLSYCPKIFIYMYFHILYRMFKSVLEVFQRMFLWNGWKRAGRGGRGLDLEAKGGVLKRESFLFLAVAVAKGLDLHKRSSE